MHVYYIYIYGQLHLYIDTEKLGQLILQVHHTKNSWPCNGHLKLWLFNQTESHVWFTDNKTDTDGRLFLPVVFVSAFCL